MKWLSMLAFVLLCVAATSAGAVSTISPGQTLLPGQYVVSNNGNFSFGIDAATKQLVFHYKFVNPAWGAGANSALLGTRSEGSLGVGTGDRLVMEADGSLVFYSGDTVVWTSYRAGSPTYPGAYAVVEDFGDMIIYPPGGGAPAFMWPFSGVLSGQTLVQTSAVAGYGFGINFPKLGTKPPVFQLFNNVTYYLWQGMVANGATMQTDGNFVITNNGQPVWSTNTGGNPGSFVTVTPAGFMVVNAQHQLVANVPYPLDVNSTSRATAPGQKLSPRGLPDPSIVLPINVRWSCYNVSAPNSTFICFAPG